MVGQSIGKYRVVRRIGEGGMGEVFEAIHETIGQRVAIKLLHPAYAARPEMVQRFFNEARAAHLVGHSGLVKTMDFGQLDGGAAFLVMEFLEGEPLGVRLQRGPLTLSEALRITRQIASALTATHRVGIVHRDLKPDNIILDPDPEAAGGERAKLLDFGIAKLRIESGSGAAGLQTPTTSGALLGTPQYMSPEQCRGAGSVDDRTDVYALGIMLFQMLAGRPPFEGTVGDLLVEHLMQAPPPLRSRAPDAPAEVEALVARMLTKSAGERPSMAEVTAELERLGADRAHAAPAPGMLSSNPRPLPATLRAATGSMQQQQRLLERRWLTAGAAIALLAITGGWVLRQSRTRGRPPQGTQFAQPPSAAVPEKGASIKSPAAPESGAIPSALSVSSIAEARSETQDMIEQARKDIQSAKYLRNGKGPQGEKPGNDAEKIENKKRARELCEKIINRFVGIDSLNAHYFRGRALAYLATLNHEVRAYKTAIVQLNQAKDELNQGRLEGEVPTFEIGFVHLELAHVALARNQTSESIKQYSESVKYFKSACHDKRYESLKKPCAGNIAEAYYEIGSHFLKEKNYDKAKTMYESALPYAIISEEEDLITTVRKGIKDARRI